MGLIVVTGSIVNYQLEGGRGRVGVCIGLCFSVIACMGHQPTVLQCRVCGCIGAWCMAIADNIINSSRL